MKDRVIYLQADFWKQLREDTSVAGIRCLINVYDAIASANLRTDIDDDTFDKDPYLIQLWKRYVSNQSDIELFECIELDTIGEGIDDLSAIYLTDSDNAVRERMGCQYGAFAVSSSDMPRKECLFKGDGFLLKKNNTIYDDRYLQFKAKIHYPCNSMILIDPYLLSNKQNIENNLYYLLDALLPDKKLNVVFQLAIYSMLGNGNIDASNGEKYYNDIVNLIKAIRKGLNFVLALYAIGKSEEFHRRMIITNNVLFSADDGFEVFKGNGQASKNATFDIVLPRLVGDGRQDMSNYLRWIKIAKTRSVRQSETQYWGMRENRLFDLV